MEKKKLQERFIEKNCKKKKKEIKQSKIEKVIKKIAGKLFVKWKDYDICLIDFYI